jgi:hypothetical protein
MRSPSPPLSPTPSTSTTRATDTAIALPTLLETSPHVIDRIFEPTEGIRNAMVGQAPKLVKKIISNSPFSDFDKLSSRSAGVDELDTSPCPSALVRYSTRSHGLRSLLRQTYLYLPSCFLSRPMQPALKLFFRLSGVDELGRLSIGAARFRKEVIHHLRLQERFDLLAVQYHRPTRVGYQRPQPKRHFQTWQRRGH